MQQTDACGAVINAPKIAMLFLATKGFPHAAMWAMWFQQVRGLVPKDCVAKAFCPGRGTKGDVAGFNELVQACGPTDESKGAASAGSATIVLANQGVFLSSACEPCSGLGTKGHWWALLVFGGLAGRQASCKLS